MSNNLVINNLFQAVEDKEASNINGGHYKRYYKRRRHYKRYYHYRCYGRKRYFNGDHD